MKKGWRSRASIIVLALVVASCGSDKMDIWVSPDRSLAGRSEMAITVRTLGGGRFGPTDAIRFGGRPVATELRADDLALVGTLTSADLEMSASDGEEKGIEVVVVSEGSGEAVSNRAWFWVRRKGPDERTFSRPSRIATLGSGVDDIRITAVGERSLVATWLRNSTLFSVHSSDAGATWSTPATLPVTAYGGGSYSFEGTTGGRLVLTAERRSSVVIQVSDDLGETWNRENVVVAAVLGFASRLDPRGHLDLAWTPAGSVARRLLYSRSNDQGATWSEPELVSESTEGTADGIVGDAEGRGMACGVYQHGRYPGYACFRKMTRTGPWESSRYGTSRRHERLILDDGTLILAGSTMYIPYTYFPYASRSMDWGTTWVGKVFYEEYGPGSFASVSHGGGDLVRGVVVAYGRLILLQSKDRGATWEEQDVLSGITGSHASTGTADGSLVAVMLTDGELVMIRTE